MKLAGQISGGGFTYAGTVGWQFDPVFLHFEIARDPAKTNNFLHFFLLFRKNVYEHNIEALVEMSIQIVDVSLLRI